MNLPIFAYDNILTSGTVTATSENASFPVSNLTNWNAARWYKPDTTGTHYIDIDAGQAVDVDYFGVFSHDLEEKNATIKFQSGTENLLHPSDMSTHTDFGYTRTTTTGFDDVSDSAIRLTEDSTISQRRLRDTTENPLSLEAGKIITMSVYVKTYGDRDNILLLVGTNMGDSNVVEFRLSDETIGSYSSVIGTISNQKIENLGDWNRLSFSLTLSVDILTVGGWVFFSNIYGNGNGTYQGDNASYIDVFGMQIEEGYLGEYVPTTSSPAIGGFQDLTPTGNLLSYSSQFDNEVWIKTNGDDGGSIPTIIPNKHTAPDGTLTADEIYFNKESDATTNYFSRIYQQINTNIGKKYTNSVWLRTIDNTDKIIALSFNGGNVIDCEVNGTWKRFSTQRIAEDNNRYFRLELRGKYSQSIDGTFAVWGGQQEIGELTDHKSTENIYNLAKSNSEVIFKTFESVNKRYFRVVVNSPTEICSLGVMGIGKYLEMQRGISSGFIPAHMNTKNKSLVNSSDGGLPLGSSVIRSEASLIASMEMLTVDWIRTYWNPLMTHAENNPLFFSWNNELYPDEAVFTMLDASKCTATYKDYAHMSVKVSGKAWHTL